VKKIVIIVIMMIFLVAGCDSIKVNSACDALKIAENNIPGAINAHVSVVASALGTNDAGQDIYFVDFVANNVTFADLGPGWTIDDENRELYPGEDFNLLIINIDKETGKITSKIASNGLVSGPPGMLPDCGK
jgi:hypothetical protein